ncbi:hypothetical protein SAMN05421755_10324 [Nitrosomonas sp. Nm33]|nr:hypothetical protein SAMN05421755_10324 [Nitrosomonas sp. Nm33]
MLRWTMIFSLAWLMFSRYTLDGFRLLGEIEEIEADKP